MKTYYRVPGAEIYYSIDSVDYATTLIRNDPAYKDINKIISQNRYMYVSSITGSLIPILESEFETVKQSVLTYVSV